jgi:hypothetical protein
MKYARMLKIPPEFLNEPSFMITRITREMKVGYFKGMLYRYPHSIIFGETGDDFARNLTTAIIEQWAFRAPRIVNRNPTHRKRNAHKLAKYARYNKR